MERGKLPPKKCWKKGSLKNGVCGTFTMREDTILTTAGSARRKIGANPMLLAAAGSFPAALGWRRWEQGETNHDKDALPETLLQFPERLRTRENTRQ
jgi:hypothetical protein